jgi:hypothetical protein
MPGQMTRRSAVGLLGAGGLAGTLATGLPSAAEASEAAKTASGASGEGLSAGTRFGRWTIVRVHPMARGTVRVDVRGNDGQVFALEILARDAFASRPPAEVGALAIHVCNGGDGWAATHEEHGLAAMALAKLLEQHGLTGPIEGLLSHGERVVTHSEVLHAEFIPDGQ